jgi:hypothetical protein
MGTHRLGIAMNEGLLPVDCFLIGRSGPVFGASIREGEEVLIVRPNGTLEHVRIRYAGGRQARARTWRLLTGVGDLVLPDGTRTITREGPLTGATIRDRLENGRGVRLEVLDPADVRSSAPEKASPRDIYRRCLSALPRPLIRIPLEVVTDALEEGIEQILSTAEVDYTRCDDQRWLVFMFDGIEGAEPNGCHGPTEAEAMLLLTAWETGEPAVSRTLLEDVVTRRRLLAALATSGRSFEVRWVPGYRPVEARVQPTPGGNRRPFVPVQAVLEEKTPSAAVNIEGAGHLVVGLGLMSTTPAE